MFCMIKIAHFSDTHLGFTQYPLQSPSGKSRRFMDFIDSFERVVESILEQDPDVVIHSGDFYDGPKSSNFTIKTAHSALNRLTFRKDGSKRPVVLITGNHDQPRDRSEPAALELASIIDDVYVASDSFKRFSFSNYKGLEKLLIFALPHDELVRVDFEDVKPEPGFVNVLTTHGVLGGSKEYLRSLGREYSLPSQVAALDWDYVALGHWHKRGPVPVPTSSKNYTPVWYAGSSENNGFADVLNGDGSTGKGWLSVDVESGKPPVVEVKDVLVRPMFKVGPLDCLDLDPDEIYLLLETYVSDRVYHGAIVSIVLKNVSRSAWQTLDLAKVRKKAEYILWLDLKPFFVDSSKVLVDMEPQEVVSVNVALKNVLEKMYPEHHSELLKLALEELPELLEVEE